MTPALPDILTGLLLTLSTPPDPEAGPDYMAGKMGMVAMILALTAQEAERGAAVRVWENAAIREALGDAPHAPVSLEWRALDEENARLRRRLIAAHQAAEASGDAAADTKILKLYAEMAERRKLDLPVG